MTQGKNNFLNSAVLGTALVIGGLPYNISHPSLERIAEAGQTKKTPEIRQDGTAYDIGNLIYQAIKETEKGRSTNGYRTAYEDCERAIDAARKSYASLSPEDTRYAQFKSLEIVAKMRQAKILLDSGNNIIKPGEKIKVKDLDELYANAKLNSGNTKFNHYKALENYLAVLDILQEAKERGIRLPINVDHPQLAGNGTVANPQTVYKKMDDTIKLIMQNDPNDKNIPILIREKLRLRKNFERSY